MKEKMKLFYKITIRITETIISILVVILFSKKNISNNLEKIKTKIKQNKDCIVLGNGPSLHEVLTSNQLNTIDKDIIAVNMFVNSEYFYIIRPRLYTIIDPAYFSPKNERHLMMCNRLISEFNKLTWELFLFIPKDYTKSSTIVKIQNPLIHIVPLNITPISGFEFICYHLYKKNLGMPKTQTVLNAAIFCSLNIGYKRIFLYGADHTWTKDLFVNDENIVCYGDRHVYNTNLSIIKKEGRLDELLLAFSNMFKTHHLLRSYANKLGVKIINCTQNSFIDAYERLKNIN